MEFINVLHFLQALLASLMAQNYIKAEKKTKILTNKWKSEIIQFLQLASNYYF